MSEFASNRWFLSSVRCPLKMTTKEQPTESLEMIIITTVHCTSFMSRTRLWLLEFTHPPSSNTHRNLYRQQTTAEEMIDKKTCLPDHTSRSPRCQCCLLSECQLLECLGRADFSCSQEIPSLHRSCLHLTPTELTLINSYLYAWHCYLHGVTRQKSCLWFCHFQ